MTRKECRINLRLSAEEYAILQERAGNQPLARYCRLILLDKKPPRRAKNKYRDMPPALLRELNAIGNNLNQITRLAHHAKKSNSLELWQLIQSLNVIESSIKELVNELKDVS